MEFTWKTKVARYQSGEYMFLNRIKLGEYYWNSSRSKDSKDKMDWEGRINLPSLKTGAVYGATNEEVRTRMEVIVAGWFKEALGKAIIP